MKQNTTLRSKAGRLFLLATLPFCGMGILSSCNEAAKEAKSLTLYDCQGKVVLQEENDTFVQRPDTTCTENGTYLDLSIFNYSLEKMAGLEEVHLTIDQELQDTTNRVLLEKMGEIDVDWGTVILMETATGDIRSMVSLRNIERDTLLPLGNLAMEHRFALGSTFKVASMLVAMEDGKVTPETMVDTGNGLYMMHGAVMKDWSYGGKGGFGVISVKEVLEQSSNIGVARLIDENYGREPEQFLSGLWRAGMGRPLEIPYARANEPRMKKVDDETWSETSLPWISIGYESLLTPMQICVFYNGIANQGRMVRPRLVTSTKKGDEVEEFQAATIVDSMASLEHIRQMQDMLENVVSAPSGTGKKAKADGFKVAGKTGTAQYRYGPSYDDAIEYFISFCGYFPADAPKYTSFVGIKKTGLPASGGGHCGPVFKEIAECIMDR